MQNWENGKAFLSRVDRSAAPDFLSFFVQSRFWKGYHHGTAILSLPHLSSQCQEQSKQNKLRGEGGNNVQGAPLWMFNYLFRLLTEDLYCTALMFTQKTKLKLQLKFPVSCSHCAEREGARLGTRLFVLRSQGVWDAARLMGLMEEVGQREQRKQHRVKQPSQLICF